MNKTEYLIKTFKRAKGKDFENYVINAIWHKLDNMNLKPVTQQYVKRPNNKYAKLDLYFPAINFAVEVNEQYHNNANQKELDNLRSEDILSAIEMKEDNIFKINCFLDSEEKPRDIDELNKDIITCVDKINKLTSNKKLHWDIYEEFKEKIEELKEKCIISSEDNLFIPYKTIKSTYNIARELFDWREIKFSAQPDGYQKKVDSLEKYDVWIIQNIYVKGAKQKNSTWKNDISEDFKTITEYRTKGNQKYDENYSRPRIVFVLTKDNLNQEGYLFKGIYQPQLDSESEINQNITFKRISETYSWT